MRYAVIDTNTQNGNFLGTVMSIHASRTSALKDATHRTHTDNRIHGHVVWRVRNRHKVKAGERVRFLTGPVEPMLQEYL